MHKKKDGEKNRYREKQKQNKRMKLAVRVID